VRERQKLSVILMKLFSALFTVMLVAQFFVPLAPSWGEFVPHDHWARTRVSPEDWNAHLMEHRQAAAPVSLYHTLPDESKIVSTLSHDGLMTLYAPLALTDPLSSNAPVPHVFVHPLVTHPREARAVSYPPPVPPPVI
jgi:hypothetical protein